MYEQIVKMLAMHADEKKRAILSSFFKRGKGEYGENDVFLGIPVPVQRTIVRNVISHVSLSDVEKLLHSPIHEHRMTGLLILIELYQRAIRQNKRDVADEIFSFYLNNIDSVNSWDLVDTSAPSIMGTHLLSADRTILYTLARESSLWKRRIAIVSTLTFLRNGEWNDTWNLALLLIDDKEELVQKAIGWMLREMGKRCGEETLTRFLDMYANRLSPCCFRVATERLDPHKKAYYMQCRKGREKTNVHNKGEETRRLW